MIEIGSLDRGRSGCDDAPEFITVPLPQRMEDTSAGTVVGGDGRERTPDDLMGDGHETLGDGLKACHPAIVVEAPGASNGVSVVSDR